MAEYQEHKSRSQVNFNWGETFNMSVKAPVIANRVFDTFADAQAYVDDIEANSTEGIRITVLNDPNIDNNGVYYVKSIGDGELPGELVRIGGRDCGIYTGNAVTIDDLSSFVLQSLNDKDLYINNETLDVFRWSAFDQSWEYICNLLPGTIDSGICYYKLSRDGVTHPEFSTSTWSTEIPSVNNLAAGERDGQWFLWTRLYSAGERTPKYTASLISSSLNMGTFNL